MKALFALAAVLVVAHGAAAARGRTSTMLAQPAGVLVLADGSVLLAERGAADRILRVDPATGAFAVFARGVPDPFAIGRAKDGSFVVSSDSGLYRVPPRGGRARLLAAIPASPIALAPDRSVYYAHDVRIGRLRPGAKRPIQLTAGSVSFPHGIALDGHNGLVVSDTGAGRIVRLDLRTRRFKTLASGLRDPMGLALEPGGTVVAIEFRTGRLLRIRSGARPAPVATGLLTPYAIARAPDGGFFVAETGDVAQATGGLARIEPDGRVSRLELHPA